MNYTNFEEKKTLEEDCGFGIGSRVCTSDGRLGVLKFMGPVDMSGESDITYTENLGAILLDDEPVLPIY